MVNKDLLASRLDCEIDSIFQDIVELNALKTGDITPWQQDTIDDCRDQIVGVLVAFINQNGGEIR